MPSMIRLLFQRRLFYLSSKMSSVKTSRSSSAYEGIVIPSNGIQPEIVVDLRSDTVTKPSLPMRNAMMSAVVGDDVFEEDTTVQKLEFRLANLLGKEAGLFVTSGTMGNLLAALVHCNERGSEIIIGDQSHMFCYEQGNIAQLGGIHSCQVRNNPDGTFNIGDVIERVRPDDLHCPKTKLICVENTHNRCGGRVLPIEWLNELGKLSQELNIPLHMDGARVFNASIASGKPVDEIVKHFKSVSVCFSKGLGAPVGSVLVGNTEFIKEARRLRKALGGAMRQVGILAAAGLYCLDNMIDRLKDDHENAKVMAKIINALNNPHVSVGFNELESNIMMLDIKGIPIKDFCQRLGVVEEKEKQALGDLISIKCLPWSESRTRLVTHVDITNEMAIKAANKICYVAQEFTTALKA